MELNELRNRIDTLDDDILSLFLERMDICKEVAAYKKANAMSILQTGREEQLLTRLKSLTPEEQRNGTEVLFTNIMDISKALQTQENSAEFPLVGDEFIPTKAKSVGCQGVSGSNQEAACRKLFGDTAITFYAGFGDVFAAVERGEVDFGILPIQNTTAGTVAETYELMRAYDFYIAARVQTEISHCLVAKKGVQTNDIKEIFSHEQALAQCSEFLRHGGFEKLNSPNTALAAQLVATSEEAFGAICSESCAQLYGLEVLERDIANVLPNFTRFICLSKAPYLSKDAEIVSISLSLPNRKSTLYRLLTKFSVAGVNLLHLESKPILDGSFDVIFYLDFAGNVADKAVACLLNELESECTYFHFLGNYSDLC